VRRPAPWRRQRPPPIRGLPARRRRARRRPIPGAAWPRWRPGGRGCRSRRAARAARHGSLGAVVDHVDHVHAPTAVVVAE
jgi:hypothetical protein